MKAKYMLDDIDFGVVRKTENAISEFDEFMEDYLASQELLNNELPHACSRESRKSCES